MYKGIMDPSGARGVGTADTKARGPRLRIKAASCVSSSQFSGFVSRQLVSETHTGGKE